MTRRCRNLLKRYRDRKRRGKKLINPEHLKVIHLAARIMANGKFGGRARRYGEER